MTEANPQPTSGGAAAITAGLPIVADGVYKRFEGDGVPIVALAGVDLAVAAGEFVSIIGPSGCGKSTLLRVIGGLLRPDEGVVRVGQCSAEQARAARLFGLVPQEPALLPWRSVIDNVTLLRELGRHHTTTERAESDAMALLDQVGLGRFARSHPAELSGGMRQRVSIVRAMALGAPVLLMDEPFAALDEITRSELRYQLLDMWSRTGTTVVFVTHSIAEAVILSDRVVTMGSRPGRVTAVERIELGRPRSEGSEETETFLVHAHNVRQALREGWSV